MIFFFIQEKQIFGFAFFMIFSNNSAPSCNEHGFSLELYFDTPYVV